MIFSPTVLFPLVPSLSPLIVSRGRGQVTGAVRSWQKRMLFAKKTVSPRLSSPAGSNLRSLTRLFNIPPSSMLQQIQIAAPCPVSSETGFFLQPAGGGEVLDGALDCCFGQTCVAGNGWNERETGVVLVAPLTDCHRSRRNNAPRESSARYNKRKQSSTALQSPTNSE